MLVSDAFPSKYLKAADLGGKRYTLTIKLVTTEEIGDGERKLVCYFQGAEKAMILNRTNAAEVALAYGDETDYWTGKQIELFPSSVMFQGRSTPCLRLRAIYPAAGAGLSNAPVQPLQPQPPPFVAHPMQAPFNAGPGERAAGGADPFGDEPPPF